MRGQGKGGEERGEDGRSGEEREGGPSYANSWVRP